MKKGRIAPFGKKNAQGLRHNKGGKLGDSGL